MIAWLLTSPVLVGVSGGLVRPVCALIADPLDGHDMTNDVIGAAMVLTVAVLAAVAVGLEARRRREEVALVRLTVQMSSPKVAFAGILLGAIAFQIAGLLQRRANHRSIWTDLAVTAGAMLMFHQAWRGTPEWPDLRHKAWFWCGLVLAAAALIVAAFV
jgi:hypothetical protein